MKKFYLGLDQRLKQLMVDKHCFMKKNYARIGINTEDYLPLIKSLKFPTQTVIIRCILQEGETLYQQVYMRVCMIYKNAAIR